MDKVRGRPPVHSGELIRRVYELYDTTDKGYGLIAKELGMSRSTVQWYIIKRKKEQAKEYPTTSEQN